MSRRREKFASALKNVVANLIQTELSDPRIRGLVTVTRVEVSPDLRLAKVYFSVLGDEGQQRSSLRGLQNSAGHIQSLLKKYLEFRVCPILDFRLDEQLKQSLATMTLIDKVSSELAEKDAQSQNDSDHSDELTQESVETNAEKVENNYDKH